MSADPSRATPSSAPPPAFPSEPPVGSAPTRPLPPLRWKLNLALFLATVVSVLFTGGIYAVGFSGEAPSGEGVVGFLSLLARGWPFAAALLGILITHEFGHFFAARYHHVDASLPFFIPFPLVSPFGTMGAVIQMRGRIRSRNALLDIGASGPLAGLVVAIPVLMYGLSQSPVQPVSGEAIQEGQSLLYLLLKRIVLGPIQPGYDVFLSPVALAGWAGLFVTALNLLPVSQLDGGHVAYALLGPRHNRYALIIHRCLLLFFALNLAWFVLPVVQHRAWDDLGQAVGNSIFWLMWFLLIAVLFRFAGREHPPTEPGELSPRRRVVAVVTLALFILLFMPTPWSSQ